MRAASGTKKAVTLEAFLRWCYGAQLADRITGRSLFEAERRADNAGGYAPAPSRHTQDGSLSVARHAALGTAIDGGRGATVMQDCHPDAEALHDLVLARPWHQAGLIVQFGRTGLAPEIPVGEPRPRPLLEFDGRRFVPRIVSRYNFQASSTLTWCMLVWSPDVREIEHARSLYAAWYGALAALLEDLPGVQFRSHEVTGIAAAAPDWK